MGHSQTETHRQAERSQVNQHVSTSIEGRHNKLLAKQMQFLFSIPIYVVVLISQKNNIYTVKIIYFNALCYVHIYCINMTKHIFNTCIYDMYVVLLFFLLQAYNLNMNMQTSARLA